MPYAKNSELPDSVKDNIPAHAQDIYRNAYNSAWEQYKDPDDRRDDSSREETGHQVAWAAVKKKHEKSDGKWRKKQD